MNLSGIVVACAADRLDACAGALAALPGVEVHRLDRAGGRLVVTQETASTEEQGGLE